MSTSTHGTEIGAEAAAEWIERWDAQQEGYIPDREERFAVLGDVVTAALEDTAHPVVVDLGCGPGSLTARLARRIPQATFIGIDADPLLLGLARTHYGSMATWVQADLASAEWSQALPETIHAAVSTTALHWMDSDALGGLYRTLASRTAPGGVLVNADHLPLPHQGLAALADAVGTGRRVRTGTVDREDWRAWWNAALGDERLARLHRAGDRPRPASDDSDSSGDPGSSDGAEHHHGSNMLGPADHTELLLEAGYAAAGPLWQSGDDHVIVALR